MSYLQKLKSWTSEKLNELPEDENNHYEYKSSQISNSSLKKKLERAASAFWNSGGGFFIIGANDNGSIDGGIEKTCGNQDRKDWFDQILAEVIPGSDYKIKEFDYEADNNIEINENKSVYVIAFAGNNSTPHMAPDNKYYIRTGAHTSPAPHFIVEALRSMRGTKDPILRTTFRLKPQSSNVIQLGIIGANNIPAINVKIDFDCLPPIYNAKNKDKNDIFPLNIGIIDQKNPFYMDYDLTYSNINNTSESIRCIIRYQNLEEKKFDDSFSLQPAKEILPVDYGSPPEEKMQISLKKISDHLKEIKKQMKNLK